MAKKIFVIEIDAGDDGDRGSKNIRGVEPAAETDFENREIHALLREIFERHGRDAFEVSRMSAQLASRKQLLDDVLDVREHRGEIFIADFFAVDANALVDSFEMRRSIEPGAQAGMAQNRFEKRRRRALAIGPGDVRGGIRAARDGPAAQRGP